VGAWTHPEGATCFRVVVHGNDRLDVIPALIHESRDWANILVPREVNSSTRHLKIDLALVRLDVTGREAYM